MGAHRTKRPWSSPVVDVTGIPSVRYFIIFHSKWITDDEGRVRIWHRRERAEQWMADQMRGKGDYVCMVPGMGAEKWERFQREQPFVLMDEAA